MHVTTTHPSGFRIYKERVRILFTYAFELTAAATGLFCVGLTTSKKDYVYHHDLGTREEMSGRWCCRCSQQKYRKGDGAATYRFMWAVPVYTHNRHHFPARQGEQ